MLYTSLALLIAGPGAGCGSSEDDGTGPNPPLGPDASLPETTYEDSLTLSGSLPTGVTDGISGIEEVRALADGRVIACTSRAGVIVIDGTDPSNLAESTRIDSGPCQHIAVSGNTLYISHRGDASDPTSRITAWDLTPTPPKPIGDAFTAANTSFEGLDALGTMLYAAAHDKGVTILELTGGQLEQRSTFSTGLTNAWAVAVRDTTLHVADAAGGVTFVNVSNPAAPSLAGATADGDVDGSPMSIDVDGSTVFVGAGHGGVVIIDASNLASPSIANTVNTPGSSLQVSYADGHLHVADWNDLRVFDVSDPAAPAIVTTERLPASAGAPRVRAVAALGKTVFAGEWTAMHALALDPVGDAPDIRTNEDDLKFFDINSGASRAGAVLVYNDGNAPLSAVVGTQGDAFRVDVTELYIEPGQAGSVEVTYTATGGASPDMGTLTLRSTDPDQGVLDLSLVGNAPGLALGEPAPEIAVGMLGGGEWRTNQQLGQIQVLSYFALF